MPATPTAPAIEPRSVLGTLRPSVRPDGPTARGPAALTYRDDHVQIVGTQPITQLGLGVDTYAVATRNLAAQRDPSSFWYVNHKVETHMRRLAEDGIDRPERPLAGPEGRARLAEQHPILAEWWGTDEGRPSESFGFEYMARWREHVPSARALWPLQNPGATTVPFDHGAALTDDDWRALTHVADAVGIRSRAAVLAAVLQARFADVEQADWLSHASGGVVPVAKAARTLSAAGVDCRLELWDSDQQSISMAFDVAEREQVADRLAGRTVNLLDVGLLHETEARFDMVDILGFFEYLPSDAATGGGFPTASEYLAAATSVVKPGGFVVLANMLDTHPQLDFVMRCVQWPYIQPRGLDELVGLIRQAGISDDRITLYLPDDGVYAVATIDV